MARKKAKEIDPQVLERQEQERLDKELSDCREKIAFIGNPSYRFEVGDKVRFRGWNSAVIMKVFDDGMFYQVDAVSFDKNNCIDRAEKHIVEWLRVRKLELQDTSFTSNEDIKLYYSNSTVESLLFKHLSFGVDFNPSYQRELVWADKDRESLLDSIFMGADIGRFVFREKDADEIQTHNDPCYEIVDGKQRMMALLDFYADRYPYRGVLYSDLSAKDQLTFRNASVSIADAKNLTRRDTLRLFIMLNRGGRPVSDEVIRKAEEMLSKIQEQ